MGLDMSIYKFNKKMDKETFEKVISVMDIDIEEDDMSYINDFERLDGCKSEKFIEFCEKWKIDRHDLLDMTYKKIEKEVKKLKELISIRDEVKDILIDLGGSYEIAYWRKHSDLNGYMEDLYYERGGKGEFNCVPLYLSKEDIENIIRDHKRHLDPEDEFTIDEARGFFWGETCNEQWENSLKDFERILDETDWDNSTIYYSCWW